MLFQLNLSYEFDNGIRFDAQSMYTKDNYYSTQDYYRFVSNEVFPDSTGLYITNTRPNPWVEGPTPGGIYNDWQLGPSNRLIGLDMVRSESEQYYQEFRFSSSFDGKLNFNIGSNYTKFKIDVSILSKQ